MQSVFVFVLAAAAARTCTAAAPSRASQSFVFVLAAAAGSALAEPALEEALASNDECQSEGQSAACAVNALQLRVSKKQTENASCTPESQWCGSSYAEQTCCGSNQCVRAGSIFKCMPGMAPSPRPPAHCTPDGQWCGNSYPEKGCCGSSSKCVRDGNLFKCKSGTAPDGDTCASTNSDCGGPGRRTLRCCNSRATCKKTSGPYGSDGTMKCIQDSQQCMPDGQWCGNAYPEKGCCGGNSKCVRDGNIFKCTSGMAPSPRPPAHCMPDGQWCGSGYPEKGCCGSGSKCIRDGNIFKCTSGMAPDGDTCASTNAVCGGPGRRPLRCCSSRATCKTSGPYGSDGTMKCMQDSQQCVPEKGTCGGPGRQDLHCCSPFTCKPKLWYSPQGEKTCQGAWR